MLAMAFSGLLTVWCLTGIVLAVLGIGLHPPRPAEYIKSCVQVTVLDLGPAFVLGWLVRSGKVWALWAGTAFTLYRFGFQASFLFESTADFGGMYEDPRLRLTIFVFILWATASVLALHMVALAGWMARRSEA
jgi:hypothetical protein